MQDTERRVSMQRSATVEPCDECRGQSVGAFAVAPFLNDG